MADEKGGVLVAGSSGELGTALCQRFLNQGAKVFGCSRRTSDIHHAGFEHHSGDLSEESTIADWMNAVDDAGVPPGVLILNAAIPSQALLACVTERDLMETMRTNWMGPCLLVRECLRRMMAKRFGRIVAISSIRAAETVAGAGAYSMSKVTLEQLVRQAATEGGRYGITANAVAIPVMESGMARSVTEESKAAILDRCVVRRYCSPEDVCNAVEFFVRPESSYVTGQILHLGFI